jgi:hypothetical protein
VFSGITFTLGTTLAIGAVSVLGMSIGIVPIIIVVSLYGVGCLSLYIRSQFKRYHNEDVLKQYKQEASELYKSYAYLDKVEFIKGEEKEYVKARILRPLTALMLKHDKLENIFTYNILGVAELKEAFALEIKYLDFPEAFAFYEEVKQALKNISKEALLESIAPDKEIWQEKLVKYVHQNAPLFDELSDTIKYDRLKDSEKVINGIMSILEKLFEYGFLPESQKEESLGIRAKYLEIKAKYAKATEGAYASIVPLQRIKDVLDKKYQSHSYHIRIFKEQQQFLKGIHVIQKEEETKLNQLNENYKITFAAILARRQLSESEIQHLPPEEYKLYEGFKKNCDKESLNIQKEGERKLAIYMQANISSKFVQMKEELAAYKSSLEKEVPSTLQREKANFMQSYKEAIQEYREGSVGLYNAFLQILDDEGD